MKKREVIGPLLILFFIVAPMLGAAQAILVPTTGCDTLVLAPGSSATILDPGGNSDYPDNCNGRLIIISSGGTALTFSGYSFTENNSDFLYLYDGSSLLATLTGVRPINYTAISGAATLHFVSDQQSTRMGFVATVAACPVADEEVQNIIVSPITNHAATITFSDTSNATQWTLCYGTSPYRLDFVQTTSVHSITIGGLDEYTRYYFRLYRGSRSSDDSCAAPPHSFRTPCSTLPTACIDYADLHSCYVRCSYGDYLNPDQNSGVIDSGSASAASRHTIHTDTAERDPRTGNSLRTVPEGHTSSVRLGNWNAGGQAESITYEYRVDTNAGGLLIMKYAAVLQDPNHTAAEQPRFTFQILDSAMLELDATCYSASFIASNNLGWNSIQATESDSTSTVLWKDWTTVGIDLTPLHGQTIYVKLATLDCARAEHYAYAYFVFDCTQKTIVDENCGGATSHTFTAPDGFSYLWYKSDAPYDTIATTRTATVNQQGEYHCTMQFLGAPANASCSFELVAIAGDRYPAARIDCDTLDYIGCNRQLRLTDSSFVSSDAAHLNPLGATTDGGLWIVDGNSISTSNQLLLTLAPGWHTVSLVATIAGGNCSDTATMPLFIKAVCPVITHIDTTICENQLPFIWDNTQFTIQGSQNTILDTITLAEAALYGADSLIIINVTVLRNSSATLGDTIVENQLPWTFLDTTFSLAMLDTGAAFTIHNSQFTIRNSIGCDSLVGYTLTVWHNVTATADSTLCEGFLPITWNGHLFAGSDTVTVNLAGNGIYGFHGQDSTLTMRFNALANTSATIADTIVENQLPWTFLDSTFTAAMLTAGAAFTIHNSQFTIHNSIGCDSIIDHTLTIWHNSHTPLHRAVCSNQLPFRWCDTTFTTAGTIELFYLSRHGADSIVELTLTVKPTYEIHDTATLCHNQLPFLWNDSSYTFPQAETPQQFSLFHSLLSTGGCDSLVYLNLTVNPVHDKHQYDTICDNQFPYIWNDSLIYGERRTGNDPHSDTAASTFVIHFPVSVPSSLGCDSTTTLHLTVHPTSRHYDHESFCNGQPYTWKDGNTYSHTTYEPSITYTDRNGCDSILQLILNLVHSFNAAMRITPDVVTPDQPQVQLRDLSNSSSRQWHTFYSSSATTDWDADSHPPLEGSGRRPGIDTDTARFSTFNFQFSIPDADSVSVLLVAQNLAGCVDSLWGVVHADRSALWAPNAFTPDGPNNQIFFIPANDLDGGEVWIYTRQGLLVTHFDIIGGSWDGTHNGQPCPQGTYTWVLRYRTAAQPRLERQAKGTVTLLR